VAFQGPLMVAHRVGSDGGQRDDVIDSGVLDLREDSYGLELTDIRDDAWAS
jgi:hypothetical protein